MKQKVSSSNLKSVKAIDPLSAGKIISIIGGIMYLAGSTLVTLISSIPQASITLPGSPAVFIVATTAYGLIGGFLLAYIGSLLYNMLAKHIGMLQIELE